MYFLRSQFLTGYGRQLPSFSVKKRPCGPDEVLVECELCCFWFLEVFAFGEDLVRYFGHGVDGTLVLLLVAG